MIKVLGSLLTIYMFTLLLFAIDTIRTFAAVTRSIEIIEEHGISHVQFGEMARDLDGYASILGSPLLFAPSLIAGDTESAPRVGRILKSAARALVGISPLLEGEDNQPGNSDSEFFASNAGLIKDAAPDISYALSEFEAMNFTGLLSFLNPELEKLQEKSLRYREAYEDISPLIPMLPELLGNDSKRTYFIAMQNPAQARGTGGLLGTFAIISIEKGKMTLEYVAPNSALLDLEKIPTDFPNEFGEIYKDYPKSWNGSNFSPHFPYAAEIWAESWRLKSGQQVDGVIALDIFFLKAFLSSTAPIQYRGINLNEDNVVEELLSKAYVRFQSNPSTRKEYLAQIAKIAVERLISGNYSKLTLSRNLMGQISENRIKIYSSKPGEQKRILRSPLSGALDDGSNNEYRLVLQNIAGNKLDYYLARELNITSERCGSIRRTRVDFSITNTANPNKPLPAYVNALRGQGFPQGYRNAQFAGVFLYGPSYSRIIGVTDSETGKTYGSIFMERNRPLYSVQVLIPAGASKRFTLLFEGGSGRLTHVLQPLVVPQETLIVDSCK